MRTLLTIALPLLAAAGPSAHSRAFFLELPPAVLPYDVGANAFAMVGTFFDGGAFYCF